jgi:benzylsuccinate CoA-transferase BbsE subunit
VAPLPPGALAGRRVLDLADAKAAYCGKLLADAGADVIRVEPPGGDALRRMPPFLRDEPGDDAGLFHLYANTSKRAITLALDRPEGAALFLRLARGADLVIETLPPGRLDALGVGWERLHAANPRLVLTSVTGFGQSGPWSGHASADLVACALGGQLHVTGAEEDPPVVLAGFQAYMLGATCAAAASLVAMLAASATGEGQRVDVSLAEVMTSVTHICGAGKYLDDGIVARRRGTGLFASTPSGAYRCRDGLVYLMVNRPLHWKALAAWVHETTGCEEILDPRFEGPSSNRLEYADLIDIWLGDHWALLSVEQAVAEGQARHLAVTPVNGASDVVRDPQLRERGFFREVEHPRAGKLVMPGAPFRVAGAPPPAVRAAPRVGEHDEEVFGDLLGLSADERRALRERGVIG